MSCQAFGIVIMLGALALFIGAPRVACSLCVKFGSTARGRRVLRWLREVSK
jgi:hypothetical protein